HVGSGDLFSGMNSPSRTFCSEDSHIQLWEIIISLIIPSTFEDYQISQQQYCGLE
ncbi:CDC42 small effector 2, partial [Homo sapiens]